MPIGLDPAEDNYRSGLTCGEHHHIGFNDFKEKIAAYSLLRNFIPHFIALTGNSPFISQKPTGTVAIRSKNGKERIMGKNCTRSLRLKHNTSQLGPNIPEYLPYLDPSQADAMEFARAVRKEPPDDRYVDMYPFTDYETIELRFLDSQFWLEVRLTLVVLIQALSLKAANLLKNKKEIPQVSSNILYNNRLKAVELGLMGKFFSDERLSIENPDFAKVYNFSPEGKRNTKLFEAVKSLLFYLKDEISQINIPIEVLNPLLVACYGTSELYPPLAPADILLYHYNSAEAKIKALLPIITYSKNLRYTLVPPEGILQNLFVIEPIEIQTDLIIAKKPISLAEKLQKDLKQKIGPPKVKKPVVSKKKVTPPKKPRKAPKRGKIPPKAKKPPPKKKNTTPY
ncbi:MAG: glutamate-cysteine ligase family protein [Candidatus Hodarchaeota archaeon]